MNILFLIPYPLDEAPSQRFRFEQYFATLQKKGHSFRVQSFLDQKNWRQFAAPGRLFPKLLILLNGFLRRLLILPFLSRYDYVFVHREVTPVGPPLFEMLIASVFRKRLIYDFDDAIWLTDRPDESWFLKSIKWRKKVGQICKLSYKVSCGNEYLCRYARQYNNKVIYNPTTIDTESLHNPAGLTRKREEIIIGWTGSNSTLKYLKDVEGVISGILSTYPGVRFMVIADQEPALHLNGLIFKEWNVSSEIGDLHEFDIGIMPLPDDEWSKGKCGFKALQYMALQIPTIAAPVGINPLIIDHHENGFLASSHEEWRKYLSLLIGNKDLREEMGRKGRKKVEAQYSVRSNETRFLSLFT